MNKKGSVEDTTTIVVTVFAGAIIFFAAFYIFGNIADTFMVTEELNDTQVQPIWQSLKDLTARFDYIILVIFIALSLAMMVSAYLVGGNPLFTLFYFIGVIIIVIVSSLISNIWATISLKEPISSYALASFGITDHLLTFLPVYISIIGVFGLLLTFVRPYFESR